MTTDYSFDLVPFPDPHTPEIRITGRIFRKQNVLTVRYFLMGKTDEVLIPKPVSNPDRRNELWRSTCFEFFLTIPDRSHYWEFNLSPSGEWNVFRMDDYRQIGFREEESIQAPQIETDRGPDFFRLNAVVDLSPILEVNMKVQAGVTSVIQTLDGHETYWALAHPTSLADFHLRESFILALEGTDHP